MRRRDVFTLGLAGLAAAASLGGRAPRAAAAQAGGVSRSTTRVAGFAGGELDFQLMRSLGAASYGGAAPGEVFAARSAIRGDDPYAWPPAFAALGDRVKAVALGALAKKHGVSARDHFLRASMYYRAAEYFADPLSSEAVRWGLASRDAFIAASGHLSDRVEVIEVPFEGRMLPGYFMQPKAGAVGGRTLVVLTGFDGTAEELYFEAAMAGLERGWNVLVAEGPGQVGCLRRHPDLIFRPDYEKPVSAMIDAALARPGVAPERLALYGVSFGGYFATRAAEHDRRIKAVILNSPLVAMFDYMAGFAAPGMFQNPPDLKLVDIDAIPDAEFPRVSKLALKSACRRFGADSLAGWVERLKAFTATDDLAAIRCPALALVGSGEGAEAMTQFERFAREVSGPVTRRVFTTEEGADMHCQLGNLPLSCAVVYDWLDEVLAA